MTKNIQLDQKLYKKYKIARIILYLTFLISVLFVADLILFPSLSLNFFFSSANSLKNTLVYPKINDTDFPEKGLIPALSSFSFNANPIGNFFNARVTFTTDKNSKSLENTTINLRKSYTALFFPDGDSAGFKNGTLVTTPNGKYYIVSDGKLRKFFSKDTALKLGYQENSFLTVSEEDLRYNKIGNFISDTSAYPNDTLFVVDDVYYQLENKELLPFVSTRAFLSQYEENQAIAKNEDFFADYTISETYLGFADGTLASFDISAFILSDKKSYPIIDADTFIRMGFDWNDIIALDPEELGVYEKQKSFTLNQPHPDGTLFSDQKTNNLYIIEDGKKRPIKNPSIKKTYSKQKPVIADLAESEEKISCVLKKNFLSSKKYSCIIPLEKVSAFIGSDYKIDATFADDAKIDKINVTFFTPLNWQNLKFSLSDIKKNLLNNYIQTQ